MEAGESGHHGLLVKVTATRTNLGNVIVLLLLVEDMAALVPVSYGYLVLEDLVDKDPKNIGLMEIYGNMKIGQKLNQLCSQGRMEWL